MITFFRLALTEGVKATGTMKNEITERQNSHNSFYIKTAVAEYLRFKRQCPVVAFERGLSCMDVPDVLAIGKDRRLIEVEVKISVSDFRHDASKRKHDPRWAFHFIPRKQRYYCVPSWLVFKISIPPEWGLMRLCENGQSIEVVKIAPVNKDAPRLTIAQVEKMVRHQTATLISVAQKWCRLHALNTKK